MSQGFDPIKAEAQARLYDRWLYDVEEKQRIERAAHAIGYGLNPYEHARPFPRPVPTAFAGDAPAAAASSALANKLLPIAAMVLGCGTVAAGVVGVAALLSGAQTPATTVKALDATEYEVIFESSGKQIEVERK